MANESKKDTTNANKPEPTPDAAKTTSDASKTPSGAASASSTSGSTGSGSTGTKPPASAAKPSSTPSGATSASSTPSASDSPSASSKTTNASTARPITSNPAYGDPTVDRLSLEPADSDDWVTRTKLWVEENPALAVVGAIGLGLLVGRIVTAAIPDPEPKTLTDKIEKRAKELSKQGRYYADDAGDVIGEQLAVAAEALGVAAHAVSKNAKHGFDEAKDFSEHIAEAIGDAFSKKAGDWLKRMS